MQLLFLIHGRGGHPDEELFLAVGRRLVPELQGEILDPVDVIVVKHLVPILKLRRFSGRAVQCQSPMGLEDQKLLRTASRKKEQLTPCAPATEQSSRNPA